MEIISSIHNYTGIVLMEFEDVEQLLFHTHDREIRAKPINSYLRTYTSQCTLICVISSLYITVIATYTIYTTVLESSLHARQRTGSYLSNIAACETNLDSSVAQQV